MWCMFDKYNSTLESMEMKDSHKSIDYNRSFQMNSINAQKNVGVVRPVALNQHTRTISEICSVKPQQSLQSKQVTSVENIKPKLKHVNFMNSFENNYDDGISNERFGEIE